MDFDKPSRCGTASAVTVLIVLGSDTMRLPAILRHSNWRIQTVADFDGAATCVHSNLPLVLVAPFGPGSTEGCLKLLDLFDQTKAPARLVVTNRCTDGALWAEALNLGAYDVLSQPFDGTEVFRVLFTAWNSCRNELTARKS